MIKGVINRFKNKPTLFLFLVPVVFIWGIPTLYNYSRLTGGSSLGGILPLGAMFIATIASLIDYGLVNFKKIKLLWISVIEAGLLALLFISHLYLDRTVDINIEQSNHPYLIIIDKPTGIKPRDFSRTGLFNKEYHVNNKDIIYMDIATMSGFPISVTHNSSNSLSIRFGSKPKYAFDWAFYECPADGSGHSNTAIDSLISLHLKPGEKLYDNAIN
ncbi:hypothetical protein [Pedobacter gandavensis]|uniref:hypothetical protein n=1 Tax=Pedobacter gandavensis TaxID=2679963 RepID=UPI00292F48C5|nr:hypothetical protein [Pedobacter gandavensis]